MDRDRIQAKIIAVLEEIADEAKEPFTGSTQLIGSTSAVRSRELLEVLLELEDWADDEFDNPFDWTSDTAFSSERSAFRTVDTLTDFFIETVLG